MDWLLPQQPIIERALAHRHLGDGTLLRVARKEHRSVTVYGIRS